MLATPLRRIFGGACNIVFALVLAITPAWAEFGDYIEHRHVAQSLIVQTSIGELTLTALNDSSMEVHYEESGIKQLPSFALADPPSKTRSRVEDSPDRLRFSVAGLTAVIDKAAVRISFFRDGKPLVSEQSGYFAKQTVRGFRFLLNDDEKIMGGGQRVLGMDRRGRRMPLYNRAHYGYSTESSQMYYSLPAIMSSRKYVIVFDNSASGSLDIGSYEADVLQFDAVAGRTAYLIIGGDDYPGLIDNYTEVTGRQPLPPRWAFGNFASRFGYRTERETRDTVARFISEDIPLDAVILDLYWFGPDIQGHMGRLDWDYAAFPTPRKMIQDFAAQGIKTIVITEPFVLTESGNLQAAKANNALAGSVAGGPRTFNFYFGNTGLIDVFSAAARDWFWSFYARLFEQGVAGTWGDLGEPEVHPGDALHWLSDLGLEASGDEIHNVYGHRWAQMVYEKQVQAYPNMRPFVMMRSGFAGSQRYGMIPWTGDVSRSWDGLKPQVELSLQMGLLGLGYTHSDLGGFAGGEAFDQELYLRWLQYGVFQPVFRPHAQDNIAPEPVFHDAETRDIAREAIRLRYRLLPYNYTLAYENSSSGMPLMRPVFFEDEDRSELIDIADAYFWGDAFFVSPVTDPDLDAADVSLPRGIWFDLWSDQRHEGGTDLRYPLTLNKIPVFVRAGAFVPMTDVIPTTAAYSSESLTLHYYSDASVAASAGRMYEDDGNSRNSLSSGQHELLQFDATQTRRGLEIQLARDTSGYEGMPQRRDMTLIIHNWRSKPSRVRIAGQTIGLRSNASVLQDRDGAYWDAANTTLTVRFDWDHSTTKVKIR